MLVYQRVGRIHNPRLEDQQLLVESRGEILIFQMGWPPTLGLTITRFLNHLEVVDVGSVTGPFFAIHGDEILSNGMFILSRASKICHDVTHSELWGLQISAFFACNQTSLFGGSVLVGVLKGVMCISMSWILGFFRRWEWEIQPFDRWINQCCL